MTALDLTYLSLHRALARSTDPLRASHSPSATGRRLLRRSILALGVMTANSSYSNQLPDGIISFDQNANSVHQRLTRDGKKSKPAPSSSMVMMSASQAARIAKNHAGGKVLKVSPFGQSQRVKLLLPGGKVTYVTVDASGQVK